ncbi:phospho-N-acetylmuramoyl-pentapeptide-transferase [Pediococcus claussenii]|uniref:Phospho-N-acetylmuramoyl-pentapeptide-transferase n=1 Tax=Pediococcus claussenii (strain ATCC BAA-344 / DSM 14800 / JCM 18046 / KCTC 3811 / LMG 21948 / P06) TaxID=701521 RepID=G8PCU2_PEDCP|nr:phospho-N-acetylmuramoyl-pentapeptide-transferase [Pediococcus claussenii]AEV95077.1 phospho-N-acetylmuramoyl-pentapeptide-transferase [Pediococcus claussenii ATCC BAA-344]ANZ70265.1 phospho-N-acetylmuramoyl-pentapeptide-transferase [Pediococcus claussenii]ANZ72081.1 phospho-N-acetylmuramoyl-pentapeptide-transferase [Pediococcus claussenii]KRN18938.1 mraY protein [Pediococcus claussenii]
MIIGTSIVLGAILTIVGLPGFINYFRKRDEGQMIRDEGPSWHQKKSGTPTMGGLVFIVAVAVTALFASFLNGGVSKSILILIFVLIEFGLIGCWDDSIKLLKRQNEGFKAWQKMLGLTIGAVIFFVVIADMHAKMGIDLPGIGFWNMGVWYVLFVIFWLTGFSNAVNLSDGLDGLVAGLSIIAFGAYGIIAVHANNQPVMIFCFTIVGAMLGFLVFNHKPAKIFMGDMGSLSLGGALAAVSILLHQEISLLLIGIVFVLETLSVILQVASFRLTGKRIFKMSPIHHHFEMIGWSEWKVDIVFWTVGFVGAIISLIAIL